MTCDRCMHGEDSHVDGICNGAKYCLCIKFETPAASPLNVIPRITEVMPFHSRTSIPLPQPITTHDNWGGEGWEYLHKWGETQRNMVGFLYFKCKLNEDEIRRFLRCKHSSVRGRLSEFRNMRNAQVIGMMNKQSG